MEGSGGRFCLKKRSEFTFIQFQMLEFAISAKRNYMQELVLSRPFIHRCSFLCVYELGIGNHSFPMHELPPYFFNVNNSGIIWFLHFKYM